MIDDLRWRAVGAGVGAACAIAVPVVVLAQLLDRSGTLDADSPAVLAVFLVTLAAFGVGGHVAATRHLRGATMNSALAAVGGYIVIQGIAVVRLLSDDRAVTWIAMPFFALVAAAIGIVGGLLAERRHRTKS